MANVKVKNADASNVYLKASGAGSDVDPNIPEHLETNSAAIKTAAETLAGAVDTEMQVDVVGALPAGANLIGLVGAADTVVTVTPTLDTNAYTSGDLLFDSAEIASAVRANGHTAILQSITILDKDDQGAAMTLLFASAATDFGTLNSAPDPDDTEAATVIAVVAVSADDWVDLGGAKVQSVPSSALGQLLKAGGATTSLYVAALTGGTPTHTASGLVFQFGFLRS